jgi:hypothetical protein
MIEGTYLPSHGSYFAEGADTARLQPTCCRTVAARFSLYNAWAGVRIKVMCNERVYAFLKLAIADLKMPA